ncbi:MAG: HD-GYP domain-containing protein [Phycisphaerales bacterium]|nr:HD-GYP domain-containing protein [Phycisphaerales bacterium]
MPAQQPQISPPAPGDASALSELAKRADALGMLVWRISASGSVCTPTQATLARAPWLMHEPMPQIIAQSAVQFARAAAAGLVSSRPHEPFPGLFIAPVRPLDIAPDERLVVVAIDRALAPAQPWLRGLAHQHSPASPARVLACSSLIPFACDRLLAACSTLDLMSEDLSRAGALKATVRGCSAQLVAGMEALDLLSFLSTRCEETRSPNDFLHEACRRLRVALGVRWVAVRLDPSQEHPDPLGTAFALVGDAPTDPSMLTLSLHRWKDQLDRGSAARTMRLDTQAPGSILRSRQQALACAVRANARTLGVIAAGPVQRDIAAHAHLLSAAAGSIGVFAENVRLEQRQHHTVLGSLRALTATIDAKDRSTSGHSARVARLAHALALHAGLSEEIARRAYLCGLVHDIGKIGVRESVLLKPGPLTPEEMDHIRQHPRAGYEILKDLAALTDLLPGVLHHHERFDGRGYPAQLRGEEIPHLARLIAVADTFDAMSSSRAYRAALSRASVLEEIRKAAGTQLDPALAMALVSMNPEHLHLDEVNPTLSIHPGPLAA